ncbi:glycerophosphodiester phosphodiesterase family protein [Pseudohalocynthiibacter aestuariivivens]|jgi:glycerophosphoryl diester phosphodiesterase|uniref:Glycerophosphodiester phosphodiesterase family protein n=1 Tax=Pseudohalocynthiibacter aestuariivivens TaxID=1591409 RepID=A0ABV5JJK9_9RHOB|nr:MULTISPECIES: glycerophosphodiester phosphodiesterase family protein [Pseudohalocynthiibacter]MBS9715405.1 phosphodiesterase [Pseudohalocynthiibacter aestuariivivens]MCK0102649.1 phosphodiesterase [Pseudohalocynthiibacter sp. F2068]
MTHLPPVFLSTPIAHRGYHNLAKGRAENSRAAFLAAIEAGYGIEMDLQRTKDDQAMVFHDYDLTRLTSERGPIQQRSAAEMAEIQLIGSNENVPSFAEVLDLVAGRAPLLVELKDQDGEMGPNIGPLEQAVVNALIGYEGPVALMSFNPHSVAKLAELAPHLPRGLVTEGWTDKDTQMIPAARRQILRDIPDYDRVGACFISHEAADLSRPRVAELKASGAHILCWTIRSPEAEAEARKIADNITFEGYAAALPTA